MCGRFTLINWEEMFTRFGVEAEGLKPRYNIAPAQDVAVIVAGKNRPVLKMFRWGLVPFWAQDESIAGRLINARAETVSEKKSFSRSFRQRRCLVPADGFYEWEKSGKGKKQPYRFTLRTGEVFAMAGLWDVWRSASGQELYTFAIITTTANGLVSSLHNRMPVILPKGKERFWLEAGPDNLQALQALLVPYPAEEMTATAASPLVNNPRHDSPLVLVP
ncbi:MAG: SOS response-associated peptidase [Firmicutes bacterium]|nr:SOS response-associated peptidase [Bacillota bacterium]